MVKLPTGMSYSIMVAQLEADDKRVSKVLLAIALAYKELNAIRARDGVPYTHDGWKSSIDEEYFAGVVDKLDEAMIDMSGQSAHLHPILYQRAV